MSDWEIIDTSNTEKPASSEWEVISSELNPTNSQSNEGLGEAALKAFYRVPEDIIKSGWNFIKNTPEYYQKSKTEIPGAFNLIRQNPMNVVNQLGAGITELGHNTLNLPRGLSEYLEKRLNLLPRGSSEKIPYQKDISKDINEFFGSPQKPGEELFRGSTRNLPFISGIGPGAVKGLGKLGSTINALNRIDPKLVSKSIQVAHDTLDKSARDIFDKVGNEAVSRNANEIPIRQNLISDVSEHLPKTKRTEALLNKAYSGDYHGLRDLQSDLFHRANAALKSPLQADKNAGELLHDLRDEINDSIYAHLKNTGNTDLAEELNKGRGQYKLLKDTYYSKKTPMAIKNLVHPESRKMPKNIMKTLAEESKPMGKIKAQNPFAAKKSLSYLKKQNAMNTLKNLGYLLGGSLAATGLYALPHLSKQLFGSKE